MLRNYWKLRETDRTFTPQTPHVGSKRPMRFSCADGTSAMRVDRSFDTRYNKL